MPTCEELGFTEEDCKNLDPELKTALGITGETVQEEVKPVERPLQDFVGRYLFDVATGKAGILTFTTDRRGDRYVLRDAEGRAIAIIPRGANLLDPINRRLIAISGNYNSVRESTASESDIRRFFPELGGGGGTGGTARTAAEEELTRAQTQDIAVQQDLERQRLAESKRQALLETARQLVAAQMTERQSARQQSVELAGEDPFRFLAQIHQQQVGDVRTPFDIFKGTLGTVASQEVPQISPNASIQDLESAIGKLQSTSGTTPTGGGLGFEGGGTAALGGPMTARLIGEAGSRIAPGTEVLVTGGGQATVLPLGSGMQAGGTVNPLSEASLTVLPNLFERLRRDIFGAGSPLSQPRDENERLQRLGFLGPGQTGRQPQFGAGYGALASPLSLRPGYQDLVGAGIISQPDADRIINLIGMLPNPRNAAIWFRGLQGTEKEAVVSAYRLAGIPEAELSAMVKSGSLTGPSRQPIRMAA